MVSTFQPNLKKKQVKYGANNLPENTIGFKLWLLPSFSNLRLLSNICSFNLLTSFQISFRFDAEAVELYMERIEISMEFQRVTKLMHIWVNCFSVISHKSQFFDHIGNLFQKIILLDKVENFYSKSYKANQSSFSGLEITLDGVKSGLKMFR